MQGAGPRIPVALSIDRGDKEGQPQYFYGNIQNPALGGVTDFDIQGVDYYPTSSNLATTMNSNLTTLANTNYNSFLADPSKPIKKIMLLETNSPWENSSVGDAAQFPKTPAGQQLEFQTVRDLIYNLPHDDGEGVLWWYPEAVPVSGFSIYNNGATALFDGAGGANHNGLPALDVLNVGDYNRDGVLDAADYTVWRDTLGQHPTSGDGADGIVDGVIDAADYNAWKANFGTIGATGVAGSHASSAPEPSTLTLLALLAAPLVFISTYRQLVAV